MSKKQTLDMTQGKPMGLLLRFALPLVLSALFQQLYSFADTAIVGRILGVEALSAVGVTGSVYFLVLGLTMGSAMGFSIPISQSVGAGNKEDVSRYFWNGLYLSFALCILICVGVTMFVRPILIALNTPENLLDMAVEYLTIIMLGQLTTVIYNYFSGILRAFGDSKRPLYFLLIASTLNIILDVVLILPPFNMGIAGAAIATIASQGVSAVLAVWWIVAKSNNIHAKSENGESLSKLSWVHIGKMCGIGIPMGLEYSITSIGSVFLQSSVNVLGDVTVAAVTCGEKIRGIVGLPMENVGMALATFVGQNYGSKRMDRIKDGIKAGLIIEACYVAIATAVMLVASRPLVYLLLGTWESPEVNQAVQYMNIITPLFICAGVLFIFRNTLQGMGYGVPAMISGGMEVVGRIVISMLATHFMSFTIVTLAHPAAWAMGAIWCAIVCTYFIRKKSREYTV